MANPGTQQCSGLTGRQAEKIVVPAPVNCGSILAVEFSPVFRDNCDVKTHEQAFFPNGKKVLWVCFCCFKERISFPNIFFLHFMSILRFNLKRS